ncbi:MAG: hypothetical protein ACLP1X_01670 [Polyangiaceae bacterium]|jgi:hypothetical protein
MFFLLVGAGCGSASNKGSGAADAADAACQPGTCVLTALAAAQSGAHSIAVDATNVYWIHHLPQADGGFTEEILACAKGGCGGDPTVLASNQSGSVTLAVDSTSVYWTENVNGTILKVPIVGGTPTVIASGQDGAAGIAVTDTGIYWTTSPLFAASTASNPTAALSVLPKRGGAPVMLASNLGDVLNFATDGTNVYLADPGSISENNGLVIKIPAIGGPSVPLESGLLAPGGIAVDANYVYWTGTPSVPSAGSVGTVMRAPIEGGTPMTIASGQDSPSSIAVYAGTVYWTNTGAEAGHGTVVGAPIGGGPPVTLASGQAGPTDVAVDASGIYWINRGCSATSAGTSCGSDGAVMKLAAR